MTQLQTRRSNSPATKNWGSIMDPCQAQGRPISSGNDPTAEVNPLAPVITQFSLLTVC